MQYEGKLTLRKRQQVSGASRHSERNPNPEDQAFCVEMRVKRMMPTYKGSLSSISSSISGENSPNKSLQSNRYFFGVNEGSTVEVRDSYRFAG